MLGNVSAQAPPPFFRKTCLLCGTVPHTTLCRGADSFYWGEQEPTARAGLYLRIVDVTVCEITPVILHGVVSPDLPKSAPTSGHKCICSARPTNLSAGAGVPRSEKNSCPPRTPIGPWAWSYCRVLGGVRFLMSEVPLCMYSRGVFRVLRWSWGGGGCPEPGQRRLMR